MPLSFRLASGVFALARYLPDGTLDATFDGGLVTTHFGTDFGYLAGIALQRDGKIVAAGSSQSISTNHSDFALARYNSDGSLDLSFGTGGQNTTDFGGTYANASAVALQRDGKIIVTGQANDPSTGHNLGSIARYNPDGTLDTTFDDDGLVFTSFRGSNFSGASAVAVQGNGKIVVAGFALVPNGNDDVALARYLPDGTLDATFGDGGQVITEFGGEDGAVAVVLQRDGKIVVAGNTTTYDIFFDPERTDLALARYLPNGTLDTSFGEGGQVSTNFYNSFTSTSGIALQRDGKIVATVSSSNNMLPGFALARFLSNGSLDTSFSDDGWVTTDFAPGKAKAAAVAVQPHDGRLVVAGSIFNGPSYDFAVARYLAGHRGARRDHDH